jgi:biopolymer transport protein ExbD
MSWTIRHAGSPRSVEGLTAAQVIEGLQDGQWEPTDEVRSAEESSWQPIESHPQFAELAAEIEAEALPHREDETRLDMNPLIDVCLVLLIFFILTTSYAVLQKILDMPSTSSKDPKGPLKVVKKEQVDQTMIRVQARMENGMPVIRVEDKPVERYRLTEVLRTYVGSKRSTEVILEASDDVDWGTIVAIQDACAGAGIRHVNYQFKEGEIPAGRS